MKKKLKKYCKLINEKIQAQMIQTVEAEEQRIESQQWESALPSVIIAIILGTIYAPKKLKK